MTRFRSIYDSPVHRRLRASLVPLVVTGRATCARCGQPIKPTEPWHLDHDDLDKRVYLGPSHKRCNLKAAGYQGAAKVHGHVRAVSRSW